MKQHVIVAVLLFGACTKPNPIVCCTSESDCNSIGVTDPERTCALGLTCRDHECQLPLDAPTPACLQNSDCNESTPVCASDQTCVQCLVSQDCPSSSPVCAPSSRSCRGCAVDGDCASAVCDAATGLCVAETSIAYAEPSGSNTAACSQVDPCSVQRAFAITDVTRDTVKLAPGSYIGTIVVTNKTVNVHGDGAILSSSTGVTLTVNDRARLHVTGLSVVNSGTTSNAVHCVSLNNVDIPTLALDRVQVDSRRIGVNLYKCTATVTQSQLRASGSGSALTASDGSIVDVDRSSVLGGGFVILSANASLVRLTNSVIGNPTGGEDAFFPADGAITVSFSTVINARGGCGGGAPVCSGSAPNGICYDNSIIANLSVGAAADSVYGTSCIANRTLVFPQTTSIAGSNNKLGMNPLLKDPGSGDFHLLVGSPAIDSADPAAALSHDYDGSIRPQGAASDMGAFEFTP
jgi:hypothetical protein